MSDRLIRGNLGIILVRLAGTGLRGVLRVTQSTIVLVRPQTDSEKTWESTRKFWICPRTIVPIREVVTHGLLE